MDAEYDIQQLVKSHLPTMPEEYHAPLLQKAIAELAWETSRANNRKEYARVVANIKSFSKLPGSKPQVDGLVARIRIAFRRKTAFMEELYKLS